MTQNINQALRTIRSTMYHHKNKTYFPYFFIVGAGISIPEIPSAAQIVGICKDTVKEIDPELFDQCEEESKKFSNNGMKYYSSWIEYAYPNRIDRSNLFKRFCSKAKISSANLMLAQILSSNEFANTVFTTNFDDSIKKALELMGTKNFFCAENVMDNLVISNQSRDIQVVHVHGTFNFYDCANLEKEIDSVATRSGTISSTQLLHSFLSNQAPIIVGYSGWENDVIMRCLKERLTYPTPLQYIWVCYNKQSYTNLPEWIKESDSVIFVIPESEGGECGETHDTHSWDNPASTDRIDATMFFKRIISAFKLNPPLIFTDPYLYYSRQIKSMLPENEDVLHLRHWTQRLRILESDDTFEKLVQKMEELYIAKDYVEANSVLLEMVNLSMSAANAEFVCTSLIREFIIDEDVVPSFEHRLNFHLTSLKFVEKNLSQLKNSKSLISTLRAILFTRFRYADKESVFDLFDKVIRVAQTDSRLLLVELTALAVKSDFMPRELRTPMLKEVLSRSQNGLESKDFIFLRFRALCDLGKIINNEEAILYIEEAEKLLPLLDNDLYKNSLCLAKSEAIFHISKPEIKNRWINEIISSLSSADDNESSADYIEILGNLSSIPKDDICKNINPTEIESLVSKILDKNSVDLSRCHSILQYCQTCELVCKVSGNNSTIAKYCNKIFEVTPSFHNTCKKCDGFIGLLIRTVEIFLMLPSDIVDDNAKSSVLLLIKGNEHTNAVYYQFLSFVQEKMLIKNTEAFSSDLKLMEEFRNKVSDGYTLYCDGQHLEAEHLFLEAAACPIPHLADGARTNLAYMARRNETETKQSFEEIISKITCNSNFDLMNILLFYEAKGNAEHEQYLKAQTKFKQLTAEELEDIVEWWSNVELVGLEESKLALSLIEKIRSDS